MRVGLLGDIHGNAVALSAVLDAVAREGIDRLCVTGDFVGYYDDAKRVMELLRPWEFDAVCGNHEEMLFDALDNPKNAGTYRRKYGAGIDHAIERLTAEQISFLANLPTSLNLDFDGKKLLLAHGTPWDTDAYLYPDAENTLWDRVAEYASDFIVLGHTHYQHARQIGKKLIINPGSVGQPRDRMPGAAWAILDTLNGTYELRRENYDIAIVANRAKSVNPNLPYLWTVLTRT